MSRMNKRKIYFVITENCAVCQRVKAQLIDGLGDVSTTYTPQTASNGFLKHYHVDKVPMMILDEQGKDYLRCWGEYLLSLTPERVRAWYDKH